MQKQKSYLFKFGWRPNSCQQASSPKETFFPLASSLIYLISQFFEVVALIFAFRLLKKIARPGEIIVFSGVKIMTTCCWPCNGPPKKRSVIFDQYPQRFKLSSVKSSSSVCPQECPKYTCSLVKPMFNLRVPQKDLKNIRCLCFFWCGKPASFLVRSPTRLEFLGWHPLVFSGSKVVRNFQ